MKEHTTQGASLSSDHFRPPRAYTTHSLEMSHARSIAITLNQKSSRRQGCAICMAVQQERAKRLVLLLSLQPGPRLCSLKQAVEQGAHSPRASPECILASLRQGVQPPCKVHSLGISCSRSKDERVQQIGHQEAHLVEPRQVKVHAAQERVLSRVHMHLHLHHKKNSLVSSCQDQGTGVLAASRLACCQHVVRPMQGLQPYQASGSSGCQQGSCTA